MASTETINILDERHEEERATLRFKYNTGTTVEIIAKNLLWTLQFREKDVTIKCITGLTDTMWSVDAKITFIYKSARAGCSNHVEVFNEHFDYSKEVKRSFVFSLDHLDGQNYVNGEVQVQVKGTNRLRCYAHQRPIEQLSPSNNVTLLIGGKHVLVNSEYLSAHSPVFESIFNANSNNKQNNGIVIEGLQLSHFLNFLRAFYFHLLPTLDEASIAKVLELADRFEVQHVIDVCERILIQSLMADKTSAAAFKLLLADQYDMPGLQSIAADRMATNSSFTLETLKTNTTYKGISAESKLAVAQALPVKN